MDSSFCCDLMIHAEESNSSGIVTKNEFYLNQFEQQIQGLAGDIAKQKRRAQYFCAEEKRFQISGHCQGS